VSAIASAADAAAMLLPLLLLLPVCPWVAWVLPHFFVYAKPTLKFGIAILLLTSVLTLDVPPPPAPSAHHPNDLQAFRVPDGGC